MALNIKRKEAEELAREVADLAGESQAEAVTNALRERRDRLRSEQGNGLSRRLQEIGRDCARRIKEPYRSMTHEQLDDLLYDERGLPR